jgi:hypothetical protein
MMYCPHCNSNLKRSERTGRICSVCKQRFAFDPRENSLNLHDILFRKVTDHMSQGGRWFYTADQLRHRASRKFTRAHPPPSRGCEWIGCALVIVFFIIPTFLSVLGSALQGEYGASGGFAAVMGVAVAIAVAIIVGMYRKDHPTVHKLQLPASLSDFEQAYIGHWRRLYQSLPRGLLDHAAIERLDESTPPPIAARAVVACPERDVLTCLRANRAPERLNVQLIPTGEPFTPTQQAVVARLRNEPELPLLLLHDASPEGVLLPQAVIASLGLRAHHRVIDVGLHPAEAIEQKLMQLGKKPARETLEKLKKRLAPAGQNPAPATQHYNRTLNQKEWKWLQRGCYTPLLYLPPPRLIKMLLEALKSLSALPPQGAQLSEQEQARRKARAVGFMSWPEVSQ